MDFSHSESQCINVYAYDPISEFKISNETFNFSEEFKLIIGSNNSNFRFLPISVFLKNSDIYQWKNTLTSNITSCTFNKPSPLISPSISGIYGG